jgi:hypothetical protein
MVAVSATTACVTGAFHERDVVGGGVGGGDGDDADNTAGTEDVDPLVVAVMTVHLDARSEERRVRRLRACLEDGGGVGEHSHSKARHVSQSTIGTAQNVPVHFGSKVRHSVETAQNVPVHFGSKVEHVS